MEKTLNLTYEQLTMESLSEEDRELIDKAIEATATAYSPYSRFSVGAAIRLDNGNIVTGSNQENIAYPSGLCAERTALFAASAQHPQATFRAIAVIARDSTGKLVPALPCGACRQVMIEYENRQATPMRVLMWESDSSVLILNNAATLMPFSFSMQH